MFTMRLAPALVAVALSVGVAGVGMPSQTFAQTNQPTATAQSFSDEDLRTFAVALLEVEKVGVAWQDRVKQAPVEQQPQLEAQAHQEMVQAVQETGLSVDDYNVIAQAAASDPALRDEIVKHVNEMRE
jgi:adenylate kinase